MRLFFFGLLFAVALGCDFTHSAIAGEDEGTDEKIQLLIVDGQNNHGTWPKTTAMMKKYFEDTGRFAVDVKRTRFTSNGDALAEEYALPGFQTFATKTPQTDPDFKPDFDKYDVVLSNFGYGAAPWPEVTRANLKSLFVVEVGLWWSMRRIIPLAIGRRTTR